MVLQAHETLLIYIGFEGPIQKRVLCLVGVGAFRNSPSGTLVCNASDALLLLACLDA